ncbi:hypothetical protein [Nocardioides convexus]|uniref:hypothetical protein n=1 Tax=Nocardioides convexus TaxID=2712224 RepID=UPI002418588D|nr:hypothetical protein [Nocardioides convexus]
MTMTVAAVGVHVLDTHVLGIASIPEGSEGQARRDHPDVARRHRRRHRRRAQPARRHRPLLRRRRRRRGRRHPARPPRPRVRRHLRARPQGQRADLRLRDPGPPERRAPRLALHRCQRRLHPRRPARRPARRAHPPAPRRPGVPRRRRGRGACSRGPALRA